MGTRITRRQFFGTALAGLVGAAIAPAVFTAGCGGGDSAAPGGGGATPNRPNILLVLTDQLRLPPVGYGPGEGEPEGMREIFGFSPTLSEDNPFLPFFPGFLRLRRNGVVLRTHYTASAACVPSRTTMLTGQYPTVHGVSQTTGMFKSGDDPGFVFLDPAGIPTVGDWFQAAGYQTYYFGKWHVSETCDDLGPWGFPFAAWDGPEPHGSDPANLGTYRDPKFAADVVGFLDSKAALPPEGQAPWFAVCSFVNPHDVSDWPMPWFQPGEGGVQTGIVTPERVPSLPAPGALSNPQAGDPPGTACPAPSSDPVPLNPDGFPTGSWGAPRTMREDLTTKPDCQFDASYKFGLGITSKLPGPLRPLSPLPFQLHQQEDPWTLAYGEFWAWLHYLFDLQLRKVLDALDAAGFAENTIVVFTSDHGEYAGAHGHSIQKWHSAYEEAVRVPFVVSSPLLNPAEELRDVTEVTSHVDLLPTLLGLAGFRQGEVDVIRHRITGQGTVPPLVGTDLSPYLRDPLLRTPLPGPDGQPRPGALFVTLDQITAMTKVDPSYPEYDLYQGFLADVDFVRANLVPRLQPGPVVQPNNVYTLATGEWKYSRYRDPEGAVPDQYELYHLPSDPVEAVNLVDYRTGEIRPDVSVPGLTPAQLTNRKNELAAQLARQEALML